MSDQIAAEPSDTPEQAAAISSRLEIVEREVERLEEQRAEAEDDFRSAQADFDRALSGGGDDADEDDAEALSVQDAADIWLSNGMDEDYMFGYTEDELRRAAEK